MLEVHAELREDVRLLGKLLGDTLKEQVGVDTYNKIESIRQYAKESYHSDLLFTKELKSILDSLSIDDFHNVAKAFSQFLNFANIAEQYHRIRRTRMHEDKSGKESQKGSLQNVFNKILKSVSADTLYETLIKLEIDYVFTAHPTEAKRRSIMQKYDSIADSIEMLDRVNLTKYENRKVIDKILSDMCSIWQTDEIRMHNPTPIDEARWGFAVIEGSIWDAVPKFYKELNEVCIDKLGKRIPFDLSIIKISSWMGGDRDGNPNVTHNITYQTVLLSKWVVLDLYLKDIQKLYINLSSNECNAKLREIAKDDDAPYRVILKKLKNRLIVTKLKIESILESKKIIDVNLIQNDDEFINNVIDILDPLNICYESLVESNAKRIADDLLLDLIIRVNCFGLTISKLDLRQDSKVHIALMDIISESLNKVKYSALTEGEKISFLTNCLEENIKLPANLQFEEMAKECAMTFEVIKMLPKENFGSYIISMAKDPSDVMCVLLLQKLFGVQDPLPIVPLFETLKDLENAPACMQALFCIPTYKKFINNKQQVMIGYSDSAKDAGFLSANWAQYTTQENLAKVFLQYGVELTLFHGRGGSVGRGGGPTHQAILSQPPGSINGRIRVTQQGEVIWNRFSYSEISIRTFSVYTSATLEATLLPGPKPKESWRALMNDLSRKASSYYKKVVEQTPDFLEYYNQVTPLLELGKLALGSRPPRRNKNTNEISSLRAIPWVFSWMQNRLLLPAWLGVGSSLSYGLNTKREDEINDMLDNWHFFKSFMSMVEMVIAKSSTSIYKYYEQLLVSDNLKNIGKELLDEFIETERVTKKIMNKEKLLDNNQVLDRSIEVRSYYLLPLHLIQVELLNRLRTKWDKNLEHALLVTISGIAAGMRNTG